MMLMLVPDSFGFRTIQAKSSSIYSDSFGVSAFDYLLEVSFYFKHNDFESNEVFVLEYNNGVSNWNLAASWDAYRRQRSCLSGGRLLSCQGNYQRILIQLHPRIRFRCDANSNSDDIYIDNVMMRGQTGTTTTTSSTASAQKQQLQHLRTRITLSRVNDGSCRSCISCSSFAHRGRSEQEEEKACSVTGKGSTGPRHLMMKTVMMKKRTKGKRRKKDELRPVSPEERISIFDRLRARQMTN